MSDDQIDEIWELAVQQEGEALSFVKNKTEKICRLAIKNSPSAIRYFDQKSVTKDDLNDTRTLSDDKPIYFDKLCKFAITRDYRILRFFTNLSYDVYKYAVHIDGRALKYISNPSEELLKIAKETTPSLKINDQNAWTLSQTKRRNSNRTSVVLF